MTNLYALIVGIEKYDQPDWNRSGPVAGAIEMAYWCQRIGMHPRNIRMFLSLNDQDADWAKEQRSALGRFTKSGVKIVEDTSRETIDTFWRSELPKLPDGDSRLLVYWCGHGVTRPDRDRILLHTDYNTNNLRSRVTSFNDFRATLATQSYQNFREQLIVADVCGDFQGQVSPNPQLPANPVDSIAQHCYFASLDGVSTQIQNDIGEFTESTLEILNQYQEWPDLDTLQNQMDQRFCNGDSKSCKVSIRTPTRDYDDGDRKSDLAFESNSQPNAQEVQIDDLISQCERAFIDDLWNDLFDQIDVFLPRLGNLANGYRDELVVFKRDYMENQKSFRKNTLTNEQYSVAQKQLWNRIRGTLSSLKRDLQLGHEKNIPASLSANQDPPNPAVSVSESAVSGSPSPIDNQVGTIPSKTANDFFSEQIVNLLDGNKELMTVLYNELFDRNKEPNAIAIADHLIIGNSTSTDEFPLRRFKQVLGNLVDKRTELDKDCYQTLSLTTEMLEIASCPAEDKERIEKAMLEILRSDLSSPTASNVNTSKNDYAKKLLIATRIKLLSTEFSDLNVAQLFNRDVTDNKEFRFLSRKIHVVSDPALKPDGMTLIEFYSKACIDDLSYPHEGTRYQDDLQDILNEMGKIGKVLCLLLSNEKTDAIKQLRQRFPSLLIVELERESTVRYKAIVRDRIDTEKYLKELCLIA